MKTIIRENTWLTRDIPGLSFGWGNGYVLIPKDHPLHGVDYDNIKVDVHGGLTFAGPITAQIVKDWELDPEDEGKWCVGFDTAHYRDDILTWPKERVKQETERLKDQLMNYDES
jgi:hypothetical protein